MSEYLSFRLDGRVALVTGAGGHLGSAISRGLAEAGAIVLLNGRTNGKLEKVKSMITADGGQAEIFSFDLTDDAAIEDSVNEIARRFERLDILVNNAYRARGSTLATSTREDFHSTYDVDVAGSAMLTKAALPLLRIAGKRNPGGASVINVGSMYGLVSPDFKVYDSASGTNPPFYGAAKGALHQLTRYAACELAADRIRVNSIAPGPFPSSKTQEENPDFVKSLAAKVPLGRIGQSSEIAGPVVFLSSDSGSYVTGATLTIDGGWTAW